MDQATETSELKPCPFCGAQPKTDTIAKNGEAYDWRITCSSCVAIMCSLTSADELKRRWNRRVPA